MKIGFFIDTYNPRWFYGTEASVETFRKSLEALGHQVFIYAPKIPNFEDKNPRVFRFSSIKVIRKPEMYLALPFIFKERLEEVSRIVNPKLDLVHVHSPFTMGLLGKYIANYQQVPLVYTHHTHYPEYTKVYLKEKILFPKIAKIWIAWYANGSDLIIVPSFKIKRLLRSYGVKKPITVLATGINLKIFRKSPKRGRILRKKLNISPEKKVLLFVGRMNKEKNPHFLLEVLKEILKKRDDVLLLMVGGGPELEKLKIISKNFEIDKFIKFTDQLPYQEIPAFYQAADIFVFSSLTETQGVVILEAIASGLPVVALRDEAFKGIVINNENGFLVKEPSPSIFAQKVLKILENPLLSEKFSLNSQKIANSFSKENQAKKLLNLYQDLIKKKK